VLGGLSDAVSLALHVRHHPPRVLVDGCPVLLSQRLELLDGHARLTFERGRGGRIYAPIPTPRDADRDPHRPLKGDAPAVARWRRRMGEASAKQKYKQRAATAECVNAQSRNRGLYRLLVRGRQKARSVALLFALAHNAMRTRALVSARATG